MYPRSWTGRRSTRTPAATLGGHSLGGYATGLAHNSHLIARQLNIAALSGYWRHMAVPERYRVLLAMGALAPLVIRARGYFPVRSWVARTCRARPSWMATLVLLPGIPVHDPTLPEAANFARLRAPVRFGQVEDDPWGTPAAVNAIAAHFTGSADRSIWPIRLADAGASVSAITASSAPSTATRCGPQRRHGSTVDRARPGGSGPEQVHKAVSARPPRPAASPHR